MKIIQSLAAAALVISAGAAYATNNGALDLSTGSTSFGSTPIAGSFVDTYTFTLTSTQFISGSITSVVSGNQDVDFTSIAITGPSGILNFAMVLPDPVEVWSLLGNSASAGTYTLTLTGINSAGIGSYGGNLAVTPVPEPETLALMFAGLGVVGFVARRRRL